MTIKLVNKKLMFICDGCDSEWKMYQGMPTFSIEDEDGSYCSELCVRKTIEDRGERPFNMVGVRMERRQQQD